MKSDSQIKTDVAAELAWDPAVDPRRIGVAVKDGVVTLSGVLETWLEKHAVERAVRRVSGVRAIAVDLEVKLSPAHQRGDAEIAEVAANALRWHSLVPDELVKAEVEDGWVTLTGEVDWPHQVRSAGQCVAALTGVRGVTNLVTVRQRVSPDEVREQIAAALSRHAQREAGHIGIEVDGGVVTLRGQVESLAEHDAAIGT
ncbi:MAG: BON domain-containing protein, partial [Ramlibacter sp.]